MRAFAILLLCSSTVLPMCLNAQQDLPLGDVARRTKSDREAYKKAHPNVKTHELKQSDGSDQGEVGDDPTGAKKLVDDGLLLDRQGKFEGALDFYYRALKLRPNYERAYYDIGVVLGEMGRREQAIEAYKKALSIDDSREGTFMNIGKMYIELGDPKEAEYYLQKGNEKFPDSLGIMMNLGNALSSQRKFEEAIPIFRKILDEEPSWNNARQSLCYSLLQLGRRDEAAKVRAEWPDYVPNQN